MDDKLIKSNIDLSDIDNSMKFCEVIANSNIFPVKTKEEVFGALILADELKISVGTALTLAPKLKGDALYAIARGNELGIPPMTAIENIYPYEQKGIIKSILGIHVVSTILLRNNVEYDTILDYEPQYIHIDKDKNSYSEDTVYTHVFDKDGYRKVTKSAYNVVTKENPNVEGKINLVRTNTIHGYITVIGGSRKLKSGIKYVISSYSSRDVERAELQTKDNHIKFPKDMLYSRALGNFARRIADDLIFGGYVEGEISEAIKPNINIEGVEEITEI